MRAPRRKWVPSAIGKASQGGAVWSVRQDSELRESRPEVCQRNLRNCDYRSKL